jgi:hypothetical protein
MQYIFKPIVLGMVFLRNKWIVSRPFCPLIARHMGSSCQAPGSSPTLNKTDSSWRSNSPRGNSNDRRPVRALFVPVKASLALVSAQEHNVQTLKRAMDCCTRIKFHPGSSNEIAITVKVVQ